MLKFILFGIICSIRRYTKTKNAQKKLFSQTSKNDFQFGLVENLIEYFSETSLWQYSNQIASGIEFRYQKHGAQVFLDTLTNLAWNPSFADFM